LRILYLCWLAAEPSLAMRQNGLLDAKRGEPQGEEQAGKQTELWGYVCFGRGPTPLCWSKNGNRSPELIAVR
jgi:hypothetical protein